jgi:hypothetical protein
VKVCDTPERICGFSWKESVLPLTVTVPWVVQLGGNVAAISAEVCARGGRLVVEAVAL